MFNKNHKRAMISRLENRVVAIQLYLQQGDKTQLDSYEANLRSEELAVRCYSFQQIIRMIEEVLSDAG
ncbi:MAG: hypothetical protein K0U39_08310 [Alphaproteobacteria bacterium]|nr:hypothetical protein [Alphaproteobacteria bacterium]